MNGPEHAHAQRRTELDGASTPHPLSCRLARPLSIAFVIMSSHYIAYSTLEERLGEDHTLFTSLQNHASKPEISIVPPFLDPETAYAQYDILIMKSLWNYHLDGLRIAAWLTKFTEPQTSMKRPPLLLNCPEVILWNLKKGNYLLELETSGFKIPETRVFNSFSGSEGLLTYLEFSPGTEKIWGSEGAVVVKPMISASGHSTFKLAQGEVLTESQIEMIKEMEKKQGGIIMQEYLKEIMKGEWSMIYIGGSYSHSLLKVPKQRISEDSDTQEFRCQVRYGGTQDDTQDPPQVAREIGDQLICWLEKRFGEHGVAYVRIDGLLRAATKPESGQLEFVIMEVECIEPYLYWNQRGGEYGLARFVDRVIFRVDGGHEDDRN
ncbi:hypothetical protein EV426DRAFT_642926 [Tirmania nivea]|nr:hypothetical protein EV426DRAFT_642926 [Tirmania nivea]